MAVIFDQQQGQYVVNQKPIAPTAPKKPSYDLNLINNQLKYETYQNRKDAYKRNKAKYEEDLQEYNAGLEQAKLWNREDAIRKEVQEREDNALQRWVEDARKAGINPNLALGSQGSPSGGGITNASGKDYTLQNTLMQGDIDKALQDLQQAFQGKENEKDRLNKVFTNLGLGAILKIK